MTRLPLACAILVCSAAPVATAGDAAIAFVPPAPVSGGSGVDADPASVPLPVVAQDEDAADAVDPADENGTDTVPMPKQVKLRAFDYRTPLPTELPVIWPRPVGPIGPPGAVAPAAWPRVLGPLSELDGFAEPLWPCVRYEDRQNIAPHAVPQIVAVKHPGEPCDRKDCCLSRLSHLSCLSCGADVCDCGPEYVLVEICVPPCRQPEFDVKRKDHSKVEFDFGDYEVEITSKDGWIEVDYDD